MEVLDQSKSHNDFHNTPDLWGTKKEAKLLNSQTWRRKVPGGAAGLQNQLEARIKIGARTGSWLNSPFLFGISVSCQVVHIHHIDQINHIIHENCLHGVYGERGE